MSSIEIIQNVALVCWEKSIFGMKFTQVIWKCFQCLVRGEYFVHQCILLAPRFKFTHSYFYKCWFRNCSRKLLQRSLSGVTSFQRIRTWIKTWNVCVIFVCKFYPYTVISKWFSHGNAQFFDIWISFTKWKCGRKCNPALKRRKA